MGSYYTVELRRPCQYCDTPVGVVITRLTKEEAEDWDVPRMPDLPLVEIDGGIADYYLPIMWPEDLSNAIAAQFGGDDDEFYTDESEALEVIEHAMNASEKRDRDERQEFEERMKGVK
jgi:hypothetical protein